MSIFDLGLSRRAVSRLYSSGILTAEELMQKPDLDLMKIRGFGAGCLAEVKDALNKHGYTRQKNNADRIRAMSDDDLAYWIMCPYDSPFCDGTEHNCIECTKEWLQQPLEEG